MSKRSGEEVTRKAQLKDTSKFMQQVLLESPQPTVQKFETRDHYSPGCCEAAGIRIFAVDL